MSNYSLIIFFSIILELFLKIKIYSPEAIFDISKRIVFNPIDLSIFMDSTFTPKILKTSKTLSSVFGINTSIEKISFDGFGYIFRL